jgi:predicted dehydrogenase
VINQELSNLPEHGYKKFYGSYEELANDREVDIIYIASPHSHHLEHTLMCLKNKKAVICEKAFALEQFRSKI